MFEQLFGSKTRVKLLSLFLNNPDRSYFVREITRKIDEQINSVRRELSNLLAIGIVKSVSSHNKLYYEADPKYQHYKELRAIFASIPIKTKALNKETKEDEQMVQKLRQTGQIDLAFLTGSFVRDSHVSIDLCVIGDVNRARVMKVVSEIEQEMGRELNYTIMTPEEYNYRMNLNDRFLTSIMEAKKIMLIDGQNKPLGHTSISLENEAGPAEAGENDEPSEPAADEEPVPIKLVQ